MPWAESEATSFLLTERETIAAFEGAGFVLKTWHDVTEGVVEWFASAPVALPHGLSLATLLGPRFGALTANFARNVREGRVRIVMGMARLEPSGTGRAIRSVV